MNIFKKQDGMTLIEILVSLTLLTVIITVFSGAFVSGMRSEREVNSRLEASNLASDIAETIEKHASNEDSLILKEMNENRDYSYPFTGLNGDDLENLKDELKNLVDEKSNSIDGFENAVIYNRGEVFSNGEKLENLYDIEIGISWQGKDYQLNTRLFDISSRKKSDDDDRDDDDRDDDRDDEDKDDDYRDDDDRDDDDKDDDDKDDDWYDDDWDDDDWDEKSNGKGNDKGKENYDD